jgi:hypothetical protein
MILLRMGGEWTKDAGWRVDYVDAKASKIS